MIISEKQIMSLIEIVETYIALTTHEENRKFANNLIHEILNQQSTELKTIE